MKKKIDNRLDNIKQEKKTLAFWDREKIFDQLREKNRGKKPWSFIDGPITANNPMGVHHGWGRSYKDLFQRYYAMKGFDQRFQNGFDGQGLWVEVEVEKDLGLDSKKEIEEYGLEKFAQECKKRVEKYSQVITEQSKRLGQSMDWENSYQTMSDNNIEHIWHFLKVCQEKKMLYQGYTSLPWCIRCGTSLSSHELYDNYKLLKHPAVYLKYPLTKEKASLLVWTTTPWTLLANVAVAVDPKLVYLRVKTGEDELILAKERIEVLEDDYEIIETLKGKELINKRYGGAFDDLKTIDIDHKIIAWDDVGAEEGTGLVHIAPGCGQEDFQLAKENDLAIIVPIDEAGIYVKGLGAYTGKCIKGIEKEVFQDLRKKGLLFQTEEYTHRYPLCWRCNEELAFRAVKEWFIKADPVRSAMKREARKVRWVPEESNKRMENWLDNMADWNISRKRYWGLPLPFYPCSCGELTVIGTRKELKEKAVDPKRVDRLPELHRPWIDEIKIKCPKCGKEVERVKAVGDCWLDAGIVPFSTLNYLSDRKYWQKWFPVQFIVEMREQVRLWFYSMLFMSVTLENKTPYQEVLTHSAVADEKGEEMHKSRGNAIWFDEAAEKMGADVMRWIYLMQNPTYPLRFGYKKAKEIRGKYNTWWNSLYFLITYAQIDHWQPGEERQSKNILDRWILSRLQQLNLAVEKTITDLRPDQAVKEFDSFLDDLSNWYIRRSRRRFWKSGNDQEKQAAYTTLYQVLIESAKIMAPFFPFFTETIFQALRTEKMAQSIHLIDYPKPEKRLIDKGILKEMAEAREIINQALSARAEKGIKVRQPLAELTIKKKLSSDLLEIVREEVNVKEVKVGSSFKLETEITKELKEEGIGREIVRQIQSLRKKADFQLSDRIKVFYQTDSTLLSKAIAGQSQYIKREVLAKRGLNNKKERVDAEGEYNIEGSKIWLGVKRMR